MTDVFNEVEEQLRSERYRSLMLRTWPYALGLLVLAAIVAGAVFGWRSWQASQASKASNAYAAAMETAAGGNMAGAEKTFADIAGSAPPAYKALALMQVAGLKLTRGDQKGAVEAFDQAADAAKSPLVKDAARLKAAYALIDTAPLPDIEKRLSPLVEAKSPYAVLAREALATARLAHGKLQEAKADFSILSINPDASDSMRNRASAAILLIDSGQAGQIPALVKAAAALPPQPAAPPQIIPQPGAPAAAGAAAQTPAAEISNAQPEAGVADSEAGAAD